MKFVLVSVFLCLTFGMNGWAADAPGIDGRIQLLKENVESQVEKIKLLREKSDAEMGLTRSRLTDQLNRNQEILLRQVEILERLRDQLNDKVTETEEASQNFQTSVKRSMSRSFAEINTQIRDTNVMLQQMEMVKEKVGDEPKKDACERQPDLTIVPIGIVTTAPQPDEGTPPPATPTGEAPAPPTTVSDGGAAPRGVRMPRPAKRLSLRRPPLRQRNPTAEAETNSAREVFRKEVRIPENGRSTEIRPLLLESTDRRDTPR